MRAAFSRAQNTAWCRLCLQNGENPSAPCVGPGPSASLLSGGRALGLRRDVVVHSGLARVVLDLGNWEPLCQVMLCSREEMRTVSELVEVDTGQ